MRRRQVRQENLTVSKILAALAIPMFLALVLVAMDMRSDLDALKSLDQTDDKGALPIGWSELAGRHDVVAAHDQAGSFENNGREGQRRLRMIGYMMDGYKPSRDGELVNMFILLPEAGQFLHPARRVPNQMMEVWPLHPVGFRYRQLVWASGIVNRSIGSAAEGKAAYAMSDADVQPASERDISKWFRP